MPTRKVVGKQSIMRGLSPRIATDSSPEASGSDNGVYLVQPKKNSELNVVKA